MIVKTMISCKWTFYFLAQRNFEKLHGGDFLKLTLLSAKIIHGWIILFFITILSLPVYSVEFKIYAKIESIRKGNLITLLFYEEPLKDDYNIIDNNTIIGKIKIHSIQKHVLENKKSYKAIAEYKIDQKVDKALIKVGSSIGLIIKKNRLEMVKRPPKLTGKIIYRKQIIAPTDNRVLILIPRGNFVFGSNDGEKDESPEQMKYLDDYYIDKYEVSNKDYLKFVKETNLNPPLSWQNKKYKESEGAMPALVSYYEAVAYSKWAGKRLPTEEEWEKAARGTGIELARGKNESVSYIRRPIIYPWGNRFEAGRANTLEFWNVNKVGASIKKRFNKGLLPIDFFRKSSSSPYGVVNMSGNAVEWTSSWYKAYPGNGNLNKRYGKQVKVIRGGAWYSKRFDARVTNRGIGGLPNLYKDYIAGFRCVKEPTVLDRLTESK